VKGGETAFNEKKRVLIARASGGGPRRGGRITRVTGVSIPRTHIGHFKRLGVLDTKCKVAPRKRNEGGRMVPKECRAMARGKVSLSLFSRRGSKGVIEGKGRTGRREKAETTKGG